MEEIWKDIKGYEGLYQVSSLGNVRKLKERVDKGRCHRNLNEKLLKPIETYNGYLRVELRKNNNKKRIRIHRLVAETFIPNPENKSEVNHIDGNKHNNKVSNLEWNTRLENQRHAWATGLRKAQRVSENTKNAIRETIKKKKVNQYDLNGNFIKQYESVREAGRQNNMNHQRIINCCKNKKIDNNSNKYICRTAGGYIWKYAED